MKQKKEARVFFELEDAKVLSQKNPNRYSIPSRAESENINPGTHVKISFLIHIGNMVGREIMWVDVEERKEGHYVGILNNNPSSTTKIRAGEEVIFKPEHVVQIMLPENLPGFIHGLTEEHLAKSREVGNSTAEDISRIKGKNVICPDKELTIGTYMDDWASNEQMMIFHDLTKDVDLLAQELWVGVGTAKTSMFVGKGYYTITTDCSDPHVAFEKMLPMLKQYQSKFYDIPDEIPFEAAELVVEIGDKEIVYIMDLMDEDEECICDDCIKAMKENADQPDLTGSQPADKNESAGGLH